jgi:hypothetical protein
MEGISVHMCDLQVVMKADRTLDFGDRRWFPLHKFLPLQAGANGQTHSRGGNISQTWYYAYRLHQHCNEPSTILQAGHPFQQWLMGGLPQNRASLTRFVVIRKLCIPMSTLAFMMLLQMGIIQILIWPAHNSPHIQAVHIICFSYSKTPWQSVAYITSQTSSSQ